MSYYQRAYNPGGDLEPEINQHISILYFYIGDYAKSLKYLNNAISLRTECDLFISYSYVLSAQKKYAEALKYLDSTCNLNVCEQSCDIMRFNIYTELKDSKKAEKCYNQAVNSGYRRTVDDDLFIGYLYNETGRKKEASSILYNYIKRIEKLFNNRMDWQSVNGLRLSAAYAIIGDNQKALDYIKYYQPNVEMLLVFFNPKTFPGFDSLRNDPEFTGILKRLEDEKTANRNIIKEMEEQGEIRF